MEAKQNSGTDPFMRHWRIWTSGELNMLLAVQKLLPPNARGQAQPPETGVGEGKNV
jgi:hypothetical protein